MTASLSLIVTKIKQNFDLDEKLVAFRTIADKFIDQILTINLPMD